MDIGGVPNTYLDVSLSPETGIWIQFIALRKQATNGIETRLFRLFPYGMDVIDDGTIELPVP